MKNKWIKWSFWPILLVLIVWGYFFTKNKEQNLHLQYIPSNAKVVLMLDSKKIANDYYDLLRFNPTAIDKVLEGEEQQSSPIEGFELPGIVPFEKMAIYVYQDENADNQFFKGMIATIADKAQFLKANNPQSEELEKEEREGGEMYYLNADNKIILIKDQIGIVIEPILPAYEMDMSIAERHFDQVFVNSTPLVETEKSFADFVEDHDHLGIWSGEKRSNTSPLVENLMPVNRLFTSQNVAINLLPEVIDVKSHLYVANKDFFIEAGSQEVPLNDDYIKVSMSLNPTYFEDMFVGVIPDANQQLLDVWTGKLAMSVVGFRKTPVKEFNLNPETGLIDTLEIETFVNLPEITLTADVTSSEAVVEFFNSDSTTFQKVANKGYKYQIPNLVNEYIYVYPQSNSITISTKQLSQLPEPVYTTFAFSVNIEKLFAEYPPKDMIQTILLPSLNKFSFKKFEMHYDGMTDDYLIIHGGLKMGEENQNTLLQIIPVIYNLMINF